VLLAGGFIVLAAAIVGGAIAIVGSVTHGFKKPVKVTYKTSAVFSLKTGDCFDPQGAQSYSLASCDAPHQAEVFATFTLPGATWPGATAIQAQASGGCASRLTGYVNPQLAISLTSTYVYPDSVAWQAGTRTVICEVRATSGQLTGSVRGASASAG
jgi:Septum formation